MKTQGMASDGWVKLASIHVRKLDYIFIEIWLDLSIYCSKTNVNSGKLHMVTIEETDINVGFDWTDKCFGKRPLPVLSLFIASSDVFAARGTQYHLFAHS